MSDTLQWIAVMVLIVVAAAYLVLYIVRSRRDPCRGCPTAELCRNRRTTSHSEKAKRRRNKKTGKTLTCGKDPQDGR